MKWVDLDAGDDPRIAVLEAENERLAALLRQANYNADDRLHRLNMHRNEAAEARAENSRLRETGQRMATELAFDHVASGGFGCDACDALAAWNELTKGNTP